MKSVQNKNTSTELFIRKLIFAEGYRYRLHYNKLPGRPDIVFPSRKKVIFVNGCFWHQQSDKKCKKSHMPKSNLDYWKPKLERNKKRDKEKLTKLREFGWAYLVIWECRLKDKRLNETIKNF